MYLFAPLVLTLVLTLAVSLLAVHFGGLPA